MFFRVYINQSNGKYGQTSCKTEALLAMSLLKLSAFEELYINL